MNKLTQEKARPIIFSGPMISAILQGTKTQTRRIVQGVSNQRAASYYIQDNRWWSEDWEKSGCRNTIDCPYGEPGELLWCRETGGVHTRSAGGSKTPRPGGWLGLGYKADGLGEGSILDVDMEHTYWVKPPDPLYKGGTDLWIHYREKTRWQKWLSPLHMPRWASRLHLFIEEIRIERLQDITEADAIAESIQPYHRKCTSNEPGCTVSAKARYARLWDQINGERASWASNPWVWKLTFHAKDCPLEIGEMK